MLQTVDGHDNVFVVEFDTMPELPITWSTEEEKPYSLALDHAIRNEIIPGPGKYGITLEPPVNPTVTLNYSIFDIIEQ